ncbi:MAG: release factor glutamine methyltransferase [Herpetosiphonaceae bacterium]|nr:MAG: release factor glutamine methyltransferase [Herpetosiphonaceae bacterium]
MNSWKQTINEALRQAAARLSAVSATPRLDAEVLLAHVLSWPRERLLAELREPLRQEAQERFQALVERRAVREPVAYLIGHKEFYGLDFTVDRRVLIPRPETELLVELGIAWVRKRQLEQPLIADLGTGSGCIAVALAVALPGAKIYAIDRSAEALTIARQNIERHKVQEQVELLEGDGLAPLPVPVDLLVSNPPYTILSEIEPGVRLYEPHDALDGGPDGLDAYRWLLPASRIALRPGGAILLEIGAEQGAAVMELARASFPAAGIKLYPDLAGYDRVVGIYL